MSTVTNLYIYIYNTKHTHTHTHIYIYNSILSFLSFQNLFCPVGRGCRIHRLHLCRRIRGPHSNEGPGYDTKQSDGEVPVMLELCGIRSTPSLPLLPGPLWPGMVAPDRALSMG